MKEWRRRRKGLSEQRRRGKHRKERERMIRGLCKGKRNNGRGGKRKKGKRLEQREEGRKMIKLGG